MIHEHYDTLCVKAQLQALEITAVCHEPPDLEMQCDCSADYAICILSHKYLSKSNFSYRMIVLTQQGPTKKSATTRSETVTLKTTKSRSKSMSNPSQLLPFSSLLHQRAQQHQSRA